MCETKIYIYQVSMYEFFETTLKISKTFGSGKRGTIKIAGVENAGVENVAPSSRGGKRGSGKRGTK